MNALKRRIDQLDAFLRKAVKDESVLPHGFIVTVKVWVDNDSVYEFCHPLYGKPEYEIVIDLFNETRGSRMEFHEYFYRLDRMQRAIMQFDVECDNSTHKLNVVIDEYIGPYGSRYSREVARVLGCNSIDTPATPNPVAGYQEFAFYEIISDEKYRIEQLQYEPYYYGAAAVLGNDNREKFIGSSFLEKAVEAPSNGYRKPNPVMLDEAKTTAIFGGIDDFEFKLAVNKSAARTMLTRFVDGDPSYVFCALRDIKMFGEHEVQCSKKCTECTRNRCYARNGCRDLWSVDMRPTGEHKEHDGIVQPVYRFRLQWRGAPTCFPAKLSTLCWLFDSIFCDASPFVMLLARKMFGS
jgi:hypothetical protein